MEWQALYLSLRLSFWTTLILLAIGLPAAHWLTFSPRRWNFQRRGEKVSQCAAGSSSSRPWWPCR